MDIPPSLAVLEDHCPKMIETPHHWVEEPQLRIEKPSGSQRTAPTFMGPTAPDADTWALVRLVGMKMLASATPFTNTA